MSKHKFTSHDGQKFELHNSFGLAITTMTREEMIDMLQQSDGMVDLILDAGIKSVPSIGAENGISITDKPKGSHFN